MESASDLIARLGLTPHPDGGWFREVHRASERVETARGARSALTTIYRVEATRPSGSLQRRARAFVELL